MKLNRGLSNILYESESDCRISLGNLAISILTMDSHCTYVNIEYFQLNMQFPCFIL